MNTSHQTTRKALLIFVFALILSACGGDNGGDNAFTDLIDEINDGNSDNATPVTSSAPILTIESTSDTFGQTRGVLLDGNHVYLADGTSGLIILQTTSYGALLRVGSVALLGASGARAYNIAKKGDFIFLTARTEGVHVIDVSDVSAPVIVETLPAPLSTLIAGSLSRATYLQLVGNILYISADEHFMSVDISDPNNLTLLDDITFNTINQRLVIDGSYAYVGAYQGGLRIIDISDPNNLSKVSDTDVNVRIISIAKKDDLVFFGGDEGNLFIYDVSDPEDPDKVSDMILPDNFPTAAGQTEFAPFDIISRGKYLFIADGDMGIQIIDVSNPSSPKAESELSTPGKAQSMFLDGNTLVVADESEGVHIVSIFDTTDIDGDGILDGADAFPEDDTESIDTDGDGTGNNADTDDDGDGTPDTSDDFPLDSSETVDSDGDSVGDNADIFPNDQSETQDSDLDGLGDNADTVDQLDLTFVSRLTDNNTIFGQARGVLIEDGVAYIAEGSNGLGIYTIETNGTFTEQPLRRYKPVVTGDRSARTLHKKDNIIYLAKRLDGLHVLDVSDPNGTTVVKVIDTPTFPGKTKSKATFITVDGDTMYVSIRDGVMIFDISTPSNPLLLKEYEAPNEFEHILIEDNIAYVAAYFSGIFLLDITDPGNPIKITSQTIRNPNVPDDEPPSSEGGRSKNYAMWAVEKVGNYMYTGGESSGLHVIDVSNPLIPVQVADIPLFSSANALTIEDQPPFHMEAIGNNLFIADGNGGIHVVDISDPLNPAIIAVYPVVAGESHDFYIRDYTMIIGNYKDGTNEAHVELINFGINQDHDGDGTKNFLDNFPLDNSQN